MAQINLNVTPEFEADLARLMKDRGLASKSAAIRLAVHEAAARRTSRRRALAELKGYANRLPGPVLDPRSGEELLDEIDREMEAALSPPHDSE